MLVVIEVIDMEEVIIVLLRIQLMEILIIETKEIDTLLLLEIKVHPHLLEAEETLLDLEVMVVVNR